MMNVSSSSPKKRLNICPYQASRTIRTEEAVMITLARMSPHILQNAIKPNDKEKKSEKKQDNVKKEEEIQFSDSEPSDESSVEENSD